MSFFITVGPGLIHSVKGESHLFVEHLKTFGSFLPEGSSCRRSVSAVDEGTIRYDGFLS